LQIVENLASPASPSTLSSEIEQSSRSDGSSRHLSDAVRHDSSVEHQTHDIERNFDRSATAANGNRVGPDIDLQNYTRARNIAANPPGMQASG
jgi:hypothetical protein